MKFTLKRTVLKTILNKINKVVAKNPQIAILSCIKLDADKDKNAIKLTGGNDDVYIMENIKADRNNGLVVKESGTTSAPGKLFKSIVNHMAGKSITFTTSKKNKYVSHISSGNSRFKINCIDSGNYPQIGKAGQSGYPIQIKGKNFKTIIKHVNFAAADKSAADNMAVLMGLHIKVDKNTLYANATDSHRVSYDKTSINNDSSDGKPLDVVVPAKNMKYIDSSLNSTDDIEITFSNSLAIFKQKNVTIYSRLIEGNYPDINARKDVKSKELISVSKTALIGAISRCSIVTKLSVDNATRFDIDSKDQQIKLASTSKGLGSDNESVSMSLESNDLGNEYITNLNPQYVLDALKAINTDNVKIGFEGGLGATHIEPDQDNNTFVQLITPIRVRN